MTGSGKRWDPARQLGGFALALLTGCALIGDKDPSTSDGSDEINSPPTELHVVDTGSVRIRLTRTACFGTCPVYSVEISGTGEVRYDGERYVAFGGTEHATVSRDDVATLISRFERLDYFALPKLDEESCAAATDMPSAFTSISFDQRSASVSHYRGCRKAPKTLGDLEDAIDSVAGTQRWIERPSRPDTVVEPPPREVARHNRAAMVVVTSWWHLVDTLSGRPVYQRWVATPGVEGGRLLPAIVKDSIGRREPLLSLTASPGGVISGVERGYGIIIGADGTVATAGDLLAGWRGDHSGEDDGETAIVTDSAGRVQRDEKGIAETGYPRIGWRPAEGGPGIAAVRGVLDSVVVEVAGRTQPAHNIRFTSDTAVAVLTVDSPSRLPTVELRPDLLAPGEDAYALIFGGEDRNPPELLSDGVKVPGVVSRRQGPGPANQLERYLWEPAVRSSADQKILLGTPFFDSGGRLAGLKVAALLSAEYPDLDGPRAIASSRAFAGWVHER